MAEFSQTALTYLATNTQVFQKFLGNVALSLMLTLVLALSVCCISRQFLWRYLSVNTKAYYRDSDLSKHLKSNAKKMFEPYHSFSWTLNPTLHTVASCYWISGPRTHVTRQHFVLDDSRLVSLDYVTSATEDQPSIVLVIVPDFGSDYTSVAHLCQEAAREASVVVFNGQIPASDAANDRSESSDLRQVVEYLAENHPFQSLVSVGFGSGADLLISYLGEYGSSSHMTCAVAVSALFEPKASLSGKQIGVCRPLHLIKFLKNKLALFKLASCRDSVCPALATQTFDEFFQLSQHSSDFWSANDPLKDVDDIACPLLCLNSLDDPLCPVKNIPYQMFSVHPNMFLVTTSSGGHCAFLAANTECSTTTSWADALSLDFIKAVQSFSVKPKHFVRFNTHVEN